MGSGKDTEWLKGAVALAVRACPNTHLITSADVHDLPYVVDNVGEAVRMADVEEGHAINNQQYGTGYDAEERDEVEALACRKCQRKSECNTFQPPRSGGPQGHGGTVSA